MFSVSADALNRKWRGRSPAGSDTTPTEDYDSIRIVASTPATALFASYNILRLPFPQEIDIIPY